jgi:hypothetical protein
MSVVDAGKRQAESVESLQSNLDALVRERQELRSVGAGPQELERNREAIVRSQRELGVALIARYAHRPAAA